MSNPTWPPPYSLVQCLDRLPPRARAKYDSLKGLLADAEALQRSLMERVRAKEERLADLRRRREYASVPGGNAAEVAKLDGELSAVRGDLDRLERERSRRNGVRANTEQVVSRLNNFIMQLFSGASDATAPRWPAEVPGPRKGESLADALMRLRREISVAQGELMRVKTAPPPRPRSGPRLPPRWTGWRARAAPRGGSTTVAGWWCTGRTCNRTPRPVRR
jgi:hypothetical protein